MGAMQFPLGCDKNELVLKILSFIFFFWHYLKRTRLVTEENEVPLLPAVRINLSFSCVRERSCNLCANDSSPTLLFN